MPWRLDTLDKSRRIIRQWPEWPVGLAVGGNERFRATMIVKEAVRGELVPFGDGLALRFDSRDDAETVYLTYALVTQGPELHVLPAMLLDDWGTEIGGLRLYRWIEENGLRFPRAEVFGQDPNGNTVQYFVRDLELFGQYPLYAFSADDAPVTSGVLLDAVIIPREGIALPEPVDLPDGISAPLRRAKVGWWAVAKE